MKRSLIRLTMVATATLLLAVCGSDHEAEPGDIVLRPVRTITVVSQSELSGREFTGVLDAQRKVDLAFRVSGKLEELPVREGDTVEQGQLIAQLDRSDYQIQLRAAQADFERAQGDFERAEALIARQLVSQADHDKLKAQLGIADAQLAAARQDLANATLRAPFPGIVAMRHVENFSEVAAGAPIATLTDLSSLIITINVPESVMIRVSRGAEPPSMTATFEGIDGEFPLTIGEVQTTADPATLTYAVSLGMTTSGAHNFLPGMSATVRAKRNRQAAANETAFYVPASAVLEDAAGRFAYVLESAGDGTGVVRRRTVETGDLTSAGLAVVRGLSEGDRLITAGMSQLTDGMRVRDSGVDI